MRLFTVEEARALLPEVKPVLAQLRDAFVELRTIQATVAAETRGAAGDGYLAENPWREHDGEDRIEALNRQLREAATWLGRRGIELKDPEKGLIDFRCRRDGAVVYLCFMLGEDDIGYWHGIEDGYAGRQPL